ncbi:OLC1v1027674C1 [Oldenlandia corymbosa var. corymbosa]|uniref:OLC1v1027674C1 n=1 Tax=Oldenlandia corymbosa var. corymbosa TaxID=529605 RepID=A0AAV1CC11_OLDCO|nr:OLC1v1027674C1 [Oldenlandia corymbosa var. corymbosa]
MTTSFNSPTRSPASSRIQFGGLGSVSRLRSSSLKKPPEPLRRAVADCLSSSAPSNHGSPSSTASEALRTLRDYLASSSTIDLAYGVLLEHTLSERERSPAVVARCVLLLKRYLLRYKPSEETLQQIDRFCVSIIAECDINPNRKVAPLLGPLSQQSGASTVSAKLSPLPVSNFASGSLMKSLNYVRSLVSQYIPRRSFQPAAFAGAPSASRQTLPTLSSLLSKSFNSQLSPVGGTEPSEKKEASALSISNSSIPEEVDGSENHEYIPIDVFKWRWFGDQQSSLLSAKSDHVLRPQDVSAHNFLEVGAAALLVGDLEAKMKGKPWGTFGTAEMPFLDQLLQPSLLTTVTNSAAAHGHLRAITTLKRSKPGPQQIWEDTPLNTFRPRARPLFQYRHYSEQQPLRLNAGEVCEVLAAVCTEAPSPNANALTVSSKLSNNSGRPSMDVAMSVLVKLIIDMYVLDPETAGPLTLYMLEEMLNSPKLVSKSRAFDLILNLGVHAHLLEPPPQDDPALIEDEYSQEQNLDNEVPLPSQGMRKMNYLKKIGSSLAVDKFECWILGILSEVLLHLVQVEEKEESIWASALSCLLYFVCDRGKIRRSRLKILDIRIIKVLLKVSREHYWAEVVRSKLICMLTNMFYEVTDGSGKGASASPLHFIEQVDLIGGIEFIFVELVLSNSRDARNNLYLVLFDYALHQINETCATTGVSEYSDEEIQPIANLLMLADAAEALHISVKLGVEGILQLLKRSVSAALLRYPNSDRLVVLMEKIVEKFDALIRSFTHVDKEFGHMIKTAKSCKFLESIDRYQISHSNKAKLSWATLHSLLHSDIPQYRHHGYLWLGELLISEISENGEMSIWSRIQNLGNKISLAGVNDDTAALDVPLHVWLLCGLLKSKNNFIRWGFLHVLERLLMQSKFLLDESDVNPAPNVEAAGHGNDNSRLEKANAVIDIMSSSLSLMAQRNETDHINILKMCDILFSQLCLKVTPPTATPLGDVMLGDKDANGDWYQTANAEPLSQKENDNWELSSGETKSKFDQKKSSLVEETASMAALLLCGQAIVPMQLLARVPAALFYWPLIQLAAAASDNIALGVSVGSKGRGNVPGATSDIRATLLLLLIGKCTADPAAFKEFGGEEFFWGLLDDPDSRIAYYSSTFLLKASLLLVLLTIICNLI